MDFIKVHGNRWIETHFGISVDCFRFHGTSRHLNYISIGEVTPHVVGRSLEFIRVVCSAQNIQSEAARLKALTLNINLPASMDSIQVD